MDSVTIVIPYIDETDFLREALQSALDQQLDNFEILLVCNAPGEDVSKNVQIQGSDRIRFLYEPIKGSAFARNMGLRNTIGDWIQFLDVDDLLMADKIKNQLQVENAGAVVSPHMYRKLDGTMEPSRWIEHDIWEGLLNSGLGSTSSMLWNKQALIDVGGWSSEYQSHQEYELLFRLLKAGYIINAVNENKTLVRERKSGSITTDTKQIRAKEGVTLRESMWQHIEKNSMATDERRNAFLQYIFKQVRYLLRNDPEFGVMLIEKYFKKQKFQPESNGILFYKPLFNLLGFRTTEKLLNFYSKLRDNYLPFLPRNK